MGFVKEHIRQSDIEKFKLDELLSKYQDVFVSYRHYWIIDTYNNTWLIPVKKINDLDSIWIFHFKDTDIEIKLHKAEDGWELISIAQNPLNNQEIIYFLHKALNVLDDDKVVFLETRLEDDKDTPIVKEKKSKGNTKRKLIGYFAIFMTIALLILFNRANKREHKTKKIDNKIVPIKKKQPKHKIDKKRPFKIDPTTLSLPSLRGYGYVKDSFYLYNTDETMKKLAKRYAKDIDLVKNHFDEFLATWSGFYDMAKSKGISKEQFTPGFLKISAIKIWILEHFTKHLYNSHKVEAHLHENTNGRYFITTYSDEDYVKRKFRELVNGYKSIFALQSIYRHAIKGISYNIVIDKFDIVKKQQFYSSIIEYLNNKEVELKYKLFLGEVLHNLQGIFLKFNTNKIINSIKNKNLKEKMIKIFNSKKEIS